MGRTSFSLWQPSSWPGLSQTTADVCRRRTRPDWEKRKGEATRFGGMEQRCQGDGREKDGKRWDSVAGSGKAYRGSPTCGLVEGLVVLVAAADHLRHAGLVAVVGRLVLVRRLIRLCIGARILRGCCVGLHLLFAGHGRVRVLFKRLRRRRRKEKGMKREEKKGIGGRNERLGVEREEGSGQWIPRGCAGRTLRSFFLICDCGRRAESRRRRG